MAYLTNYSFKQLVEQTEIQNIDRISLEFFTAKIYDNQHLYYFFNQLELKKLFRSIIILSDDKSYVLVYRNVPERIDDYSMFQFSKNRTFLKNLKNNILIYNKISIFYFYKNYKKIIKF